MKVLEKASAQSRAMSIVLSLLLATTMFTAPAYAAENLYAVGLVSEEMEISTEDDGSASDSASGDAEVAAAPEGEEGNAATPDDSEGEGAEEEQQPDEGEPAKDDPNQGDSNQDDPKEVGDFLVIGEEGKDYTFDEEQGELTILGNATVSNKQDVATTAQHIVVEGEAQLALNGVTIDARETGHSALSLAENAKATLLIQGDCELVGGENHAGIHVAESAALAVKGNAAAKCSLKAVGNAGIDYRTASEKTAANSSAGSGIGGTKGAGATGSITINGADRNLTVSAIGGGTHASGIGPCGGDGSDITITGTNLVNVSGGNKHGEVGSNADYAKQALEGGPAIGGGSKGKECGTITIENCYGTNIVGGSKSAGIGSGCWGSKTKVVIANSELSVQGGMTGSAIGGGRMDSFDSAAAAPVVDVSIADSTIVAVGGYFGAGIGLGTAVNKNLPKSSVAISGSRVEAYGGAGAAGIGGGVRGYNVDVKITGVSNVTAYAGGAYQAKYIQRWNGKVVTFGEEGAAQSDAAAIGRGSWGSMGFSTSADWGDFSEQAVRPELAISADSTVVAVAPGGNWAIAGFQNTDGVDAPILQARFSRNFDVAEREFITRTIDEENLDRDVCFADGEKELVLKVRKLGEGDDSFTTVKTVTLNSIESIRQAHPELFENMAGGEFDNGWDNGTARYGYYAVAFNVPEPGGYKIATDSDLRTMTRQGDEEISEGAEGYKGGLTHVLDAEREDVFAVAKGVNNFDQGAFRVDADEEPEPTNPPEDPVVPVTPVEPDPEPQPDPDPEPEPGPEPQPAPDPDPEPQPGPEPEPEPAPEPDSDPDPISDPDPAPAPAPVEPQTSDDPADVDADGPADDASDEPSDEPTENPSGDLTKPADDPDENPADDPTDDPADDPAENPAADPADDPTDDPAGDQNKAGEGENARTNAAPRTTPRVTAASTTGVATSRTTAPAPTASAPAPTGVGSTPAQSTGFVTASDSIGNAPVPEVIADEDNPLAGQGHLDCWVHRFIIVCMLLTAVYSALVIARRKSNSDKMQKLDDNAMGVESDVWRESAGSDVALPQLSPQTA